MNVKEFTELAQRNPKAMALLARKLSHTSTPITLQQVDHLRCTMTKLSLKDEELIECFFNELVAHGVTIQIVDHDARIDAEIRATRENKALWSRIKEQDRLIRDLADELCDLKMPQYQAEISRLVKLKAEKEEETQS